jgi:hypothetical protein
VTPFYHALITGQAAQRAVRVTKVSVIDIGMNPKKKRADFFMLLIDEGHAWSWNLTVPGFPSA